MRMNAALPPSLMPYSAAYFRLSCPSFYKHPPASIMNQEKLRRLQIVSGQKERPSGAFWVIVCVVVLVLAFGAWFAWPRAGDQQRVKFTGVKPPTNSTPARVAGSGDSSASTAGDSSGYVLTVSGYIINRERIEISPRYLGVVKWIGVRKGDAVTNGQVVVILDDAEYRARLREAQGRVASAAATVSRAELDFERVRQLAKTEVESKKSDDDARLMLEAARADLTQAQGARDLVQTYLDWTVIRSPIIGVVVVMVVNPNELVVPQSFGGGRGPSTGLTALQDTRG